MVSAQSFRLTEALISLIAAALTMYLHARKLGDLMVDPSNYEDLATWQIQALLVAINALCVVEPRNAWFTIPLAPDSGREVRG